ncbi:MAG TPA: D-glycero-beta-D-manno-heptose-7-phosphate kinase [bacterium]|nr:D-glycero-beta-D-manno-heptose-7-phosphate kinase [bacterium]HPN45383.1 D-glycero-beta-D-manno-heptose-7-phosphate kinase [bacterium]
MKKYSLKQIELFIHKIQQQRILVIGDLMLDQFIWGKVNRISPEAPVPVVHVTHESAYPGGAANVARNIADFGGQATICGMVGSDVHGQELLALLGQSRINTGGVIVRNEYTTIVKTRIIARQQQVVRVDRESVEPLIPAMYAALPEKLEQIIHNVDAVIIEDYGKGFITQPLVDKVTAICRTHNKIITVDPNPGNPLQWQGVTLVKPNRAEAYQSAGLPYNEDKQSLLQVGETLLNKWQSAGILITLGEDGLMLFQPPEQPFHTPTKAREVFDVSGAGDTVIAFYTAALAAGLTGAEAAQVANHAAGIVVGKLGTATLTPDELLKSFQDNE